MKIRFATPEDSAALLEIYAQYIDTPVTFECTLPSEEEFRRRIVEIGRDYPYLIGEEGERIIGYAYAHRQMEREAYQWNAELSVYLEQNHTSRGNGKRLYCTLMDILKLQGVRTVYGGVTVPNEKSERLHESLGFQRLGPYHNTGYKAGSWHDVTWFEKQIAPYTIAPSPFIPLHKLLREQLEAGFLFADKPY